MYIIIIIIESNDSLVIPDRRLPSDILASLRAAEAGTNLRKLGQHSTTKASTLNCLQKALTENSAQFAFKEQTRATVNKTNTGRATRAVHQGRFYHYHRPSIQ